MIDLMLALGLAAAPAAGEANVTIDGETTTYRLAACTMESEGAMPARILIEEMDLTLNAAHADRIQTISVIQNNNNWSASRLFNGESWTDRGKPSEPVVIEWGQTIRVEALLTSTQTDGEKTVSVTARCA